MAEEMPRYFSWYLALKLLSGKAAASNEYNNNSLSHNSTPVEYSRGEIFFRAFRDKKREQSKTCRLEHVAFYPLRSRLAMLFVRSTLLSSNPGDLDIFLEEQYLGSPQHLGLQAFLAKRMLLPFWKEV